MRILFLYAFILFAISVGCKENHSTKESKTESKKTIQEKILQTKDTTTEKTIKDFVPNGYFILDSTSGVIQNDVAICVLVLANENEKVAEATVEENRIVKILHQQKGGWQLSAENDQLVLCKDCGGIFGDPYAGITVKKNVLTIANYGGSAWRWSQQHIFRYQENEWQLIGATYQSYFNAKECNGEAGLAGRQLEDINFSSSKMHIIHSHSDDCEPFENYKKAFGKKKPITLSNFPGQPNQWPSERILDGDGKD